MSNDTLFRVIISSLRGVRGRVLMDVNFKPLAPHRCWFESRQELWNLSCEQVIQLVYIYRTSIVQLKFNYLFVFDLFFERLITYLFTFYHVYLKINDGTSAVNRI
jgi:hypothetical protein